MLSKKIQEKFRQSRYTSVKDWKDQTKCPLALFTCTSIINQDKEPSIPTFIQMAYCLDMPPEEIAETCKAAGDDIFWRLIIPSSATDEEQYVLNKIRKLNDSAKKKLVMDLLNTLGV